MRDMDPPVSNAFRDSGSISFGSSRANQRVSQASAAARVSPAPWQARRELIEIHPVELASLLRHWKRLPAPQLYRGPRSGRSSSRGVDSSIYKRLAVGDMRCDTLSIPRAPETVASALELRSWLCDG